MGWKTIFGVFYYSITILKALSSWTNLLLNNTKPFHWLMLRIWSIHTVFLYLQFSIRLWCRIYSLAKWRESIFRGGIFYFSSLALEVIWKFLLFGERYCMLSPQTMLITINLNLSPLLPILMFTVIDRWLYFILNSNILISSLFILLIAWFFRFLEEGLFRIRFC